MIQIHPSTQHTWRKRPFPDTRTHRHPLPASVTVIKQSVVHQDQPRTHRVFSGRLLLQSCSTDSLRKSVVPRAIRLFNTSTGDWECGLGDQGLMLFCYILFTISWCYPNNSFSFRVSSLLSVLHIIPICIDSVSRHFHNVYRTIVLNCTSRIAVHFIIIIIFLLA